MPDEQVTNKAKLLAILVEAYRAEYDDLSKIWSGLDTKAQGNVTICGIFVAGVLAFVRDVSHGTPLDRLVFITLALICLVASILASIRALRISEVRSAPMGIELDGMVNDLTALDTVEDERMEFFLHDHAKLWLETNSEIQKLNDGKAYWVEWSQVLITAAILLATAFIVLVIWEKT